MAVNPVDFRLWIPVVCTDRDRHKQRRLYFLTQRDEGAKILLVKGWYKLRSPDHYQAIAPSVRGAYTFTCPRCGRSSEVSADNLRALVDGLVASGVSSLDISALPF